MIVWPQLQQQKCWATISPTNSHNFTTPITILENKKKNQQRTFLQSNSFAFDETAIGTGRKALKKYTAHKTTFIHIQIFCCICYFFLLLLLEIISLILAPCFVWFYFIFFFVLSYYCEFSFVVDTIHKILFIRFNLKQQIKTINKIQAEQV